MSTGYQNFYLLCKNYDFRPEKQPNFAQNWYFWPNIGIFGPFGLKTDQKTMRTMLKWFFHYVGTKTFASSRFKLAFLAQKQPNLAQNMHLWSFWAKCWNFWPIWSHARPQINAIKMPRCFFPLCEYQNFCFLSKILGILAQIKPNFAHNMLSWTHTGALWPIWYCASFRDK